MRGKWAYDSISFLDARPERIDFNREYGITGWKELDKWLEQNVK